MGEWSGVMKNQIEIDSVNIPAVWPWSSVLSLISVRPRNSEIIKEEDIDKKKEASSLDNGQDFFEISQRMLENGPTHYLSHRWNTTDPTDQWDPACNSRVFKSKKRLVQFFQRNHPYHLDWSNLCRKQWGRWRLLRGCLGRIAWMRSTLGRLWT